MNEEYKVVISVESNRIEDKTMPIERIMIVRRGNVDINASVESMIDTIEETKSDE